MHRSCESPSGERAAWELSARSQGCSKPQCCKVYCAPRRQALMCGALWLVCSLVLHYSFKQTSDAEQLTVITLQMVTPD